MEDDRKSITCAQTLTISFVVADILFTFSLVQLIRFSSLIWFDSILGIDILFLSSIISKNIDNCYHIQI